jgi:hypothetical protein
MLQIDSETEIDALRAQLRYDQAALELVTAQSGDLLPNDVAPPVVEPRAARVRFDVASLGDSGVVGSGNLMRLRFRALAPRPSTMVSVQQFAASDVEGLALPVMAPRPFVIVVSP